MDQTARLAEHAAADDLVWLTSSTPVPYPEALAFMEQRVAGIVRGEMPETVWLLEHPPLYTAGTSAKAAHVLAPGHLPVFQTGRGGAVTYHGPGQRIAYLMLDLRRRGADIRRFVANLEQWLINTLSCFGIVGERREGRIGVWVVTPAGEAKIAAIGVRVRRFVTFHGVALNVAPDLTHFAGIVPCGLAGASATSLAALGVAADMATVDAILTQEFTRVFGPG